MTPQSMFMMIDAVRDGYLERLRALLETLNTSPGIANAQNPLIPFADFSRLHSARLVIIEAHTANDIRAFGIEPKPWKTSLALLGDVDGDRDSFLAELAVRAGVGLEQILDCCASFPGHHGTLLEWMQAHSAKPAARYVNWIGRTVQQVREDKALHRCLADALPGVLDSVAPDDARVVRRTLIAHVQREIHADRLTLSPVERTPIAWRLKNTLHLIGVPLLLVLVAPLLLFASPLLLWRLRVHERRDPDVAIRPNKDHVRTLSILEDRDVTNQFNVFGDVKPGLFRRYALSFALLLIDYSARHVYRRGFLGRVRSIHFARWVWLDDRRRLYFASMYDGSLESYMDDFINKVAFGLNLVFSHGVGYPRTRWVIKGGAEYEQEFKDTLRRHQLPSAVWYRANPGLTAHDMARNAALRAGYERRPTSVVAIRRWLAEI